MKRPSFQFYPADWRNNAKLRRCSEAARGAWIDILCILHDSDEYGVVRWPLADLARASGVSSKLIKELIEKNVLKGGEKGCETYIYTPISGRVKGDPVELLIANDGKPCWYCSRFVRDEHIRNVRGKDTQFTSPKASPKPPIGEGKSDGSTSTSTSTNKDKSLLKNTALTRPPSVTEQTWNDFSKQRAANKAPLTATALSGIEEEAVKAGIKLEAALVMACNRGWRSFKASWIVEKPNQNAPPNAASRAEKKNEWIAGLTGQNRSEDATNRTSSNGSVIDVKASVVG